MFKDEEGKYHNDNGPAIITKTGVYFISHGHDWLPQRYENFIRELAVKLYPEQDLPLVPFTQLESIIMAEKGWIEKRSFLSGLTDNMNTRLTLGKTNRTPKTIF